MKAKALSKSSNKPTSKDLRSSKSCPTITVDKNWTTKTTDSTEVAMFGKKRGRRKRSRKVTGGVKNNIQCMNTQ